MTVEVRLFAGLQKYVKGTKGGEPFKVTLDGLVTLAGLISHLGIPVQEAYVKMVNGCALPVTTELAEGDRIGIFPPVGGG